MGLHETKITRVFEDVRDLVLTATFPDDKTSADIIDITFVVKEFVTDDIADAKINKTLSGGIIEFEEPNTIKVGYDVTDYVGFVKGQQYVAGLYFKFNGDEDFNEDTEEFEYLVVESMLNDN